MVNYILKGIDRIELELRGSRLSDEEFKQIAKRTEKFMYEVYTRSENTRSDKNAHAEALAALRNIRDLAK